MIFDANLIQDMIASYGYAAVFVVVLLESSGIPLPGETILVCASVYAGTQHGLDIRVIIGAAASGALEMITFSYDGLKAIGEAHEKGDREARIRMYAQAFAACFLDGKEAGENPGAVTEEEVLERTGLTLEEVRFRSFSKILPTRLG